MCVPKTVTLSSLAILALFQYFYLNCCVSFMAWDNSQLQRIRKKTLAHWHTVMAHLLIVRYVSLWKDSYLEVWKHPELQRPMVLGKSDVLIIKQGSWEQIHQIVISSDTAKWLSMRASELGGTSQQFCFYFVTTTMYKETSGKNNITVNLT